MAVIHREPCDVCKKKFPISDMHDVCKQTAKRTFSSPAEYEDVYVCARCWALEEQDPDYERANLRFKESHGGEL